MNYRHAYHAGNFADVLKHAALVAVLEHLKKKPAGFAVVDSHAGRGLYDLGGAEARKTGEAQGGILKLLEAGHLPGVLRTYVDAVRSFGPARYPGSPLLALKLLREKDRLVAIEKHPEEYEKLAAALGGDRRARAVLGDGYELAKFLPPAQHRGVVLIDPPYEAADEFEIATRALIAAYRRFATGIYLVWYPAKEAANIEAAIGELLTGGIKELLRLELDVGAGAADVPRLSTTGLLVVNPPYGFAAQMNEAGSFLAGVLGKSVAAGFRVDTLAGEG